MSVRKQKAFTTLRTDRDLVAMLRQMFEFKKANRWPTFDVSQTDNQFNAKVELPGLKKNDIKVEVSQDALIVTGERRIEIENDKPYVYRCNRSVPLPKGANLYEVKATFADGILEVNVPLTVLLKEKVRTVKIEERAKPRKHAA